MSGMLVSNGESEGEWGRREEGRGREVGREGKGEEGVEERLDF